MESSMQMDRPATWSEVCDAISLSFHGTIKLGYACGADFEIEDDFNEPARLAKGDLDWLALASEMLDRDKN